MFWQVYTSLVLGCVVPIVLLFPQPTQSQFLVPSLFPNFPPTIKFSNPNNASHKYVIPTYLQEFLYWAPSAANQGKSRKFYDLVLTTTGIPISEDKNWIGQLRSPGTGHKIGSSQTNRYKKIDMFYGQGLLALKDNMATNIKKSAIKYGTDFKFILETYNFKSESNQLKSRMMKHKDWVWIVKPAAGTLSAGIFFIKDYTELEKELRARNSSNKRYVVQRYLTNPRLTPETNQTLEYRVYALITSVLPLRVYTSYETFMVLGSTLSNLSNSTNHCDSMFSPGKLHECEKDWADVLKYFPALTKEIFQPAEIQKIKADSSDIIVKTLTPVLPKWEKLTMRKQFNNYNTFQMFAFDFLLDKNLKSYLSEINARPMEYKAGAEFGVGTDYVRYSPTVSRLNIVGYNLPPTIPMEIRKQICADMKMTENYEASCIDSIVFNECLHKFPTAKSLAPTTNSENYTEDALRMLALAEDELQRSKLDNIFQRIYPTKDTRKYIKYMDKDSVNYNAALIMADWEEKYNGKRETGVKFLQEMIGKHKVCISQE